MNASERRKELLKWLDREGSLSTREIAEHFNITKMTVHRDLSLLESRQALRRIHGGALANPTPRGAGKPASPEAAETTQGKCLVCFRPATQHLIYSLAMENGEQKQACCAHCGVSAHILHRDRVVMALTADYLTGRQHSAQNSTFLMGSAATPCCHPSMLTFESREMAERFQAGFGGTLGSLNDAIVFLEHDLSIDHEKCPKCSKGGAA